MTDEEGRDIGSAAIGFDGSRLSDLASRSFNVHKRIAAIIASTGDAHD